MCIFKKEIKHLIFTIMYFFLSACSFNPTHYQPDSDFGYLYGRFIQNGDAYLISYMSDMGSVSHSHSPMYSNSEHAKYNSIGFCQFINIHTNDIISDFQLYTNTDNATNIALKNNRPRAVVAGIYTLHKCIIPTEYKDHEFELTRSLKNKTFKIQAGKITYLGEIRITKPYYKFKSYTETTAKHVIYSELNVIQNPIHNIEFLKNNYPLFSKLPIEQVLFEFESHTSILEEWR